ncbi:MAG: polysaccharide deacetylase family protein [Polyangiaceae bacterium]|nr:polysaccharide deacetylase family protein [Polyangiaceae bacterium]
MFARWLVKGMVFFVLLATTLRARGETSTPRGQDAPPSQRLALVRPAELTATEPRGPTPSPASTPVRATVPAPADDALAPDSSCVLPERRWQPGLFASDPRVPGEVVLTFDDGPNPWHTPRVLDLLAEFHLPATFFVVGAAINRRTYPLIQRIVAEGHTLGAHTYNHDIDLAFRAWDDGDYVQGQYVLGQIMIELALLATSADDFARLHRQVFGVASGHYQSVGSIRRHWHEYAERHAELLAQYGYNAEHRPYALVLARPPGGLPYVARSIDPRARLRHERALSRLGWLNILWHGGSGDTDPKHKNEPGFLLGNLRYQERLGGVLLMHDYMRKDALRTALRTMASSPKIIVVGIDRLLSRKFGCGRAALARALRPARPAISATRVADRMSAGE